jgi:hypothetical protein
MKTTRINIVLLLVLMAILVVPVQAFGLEAGLYSFAGPSVNLPGGPDSYAIDLAGGAWAETIGGTITIVPAGYAHYAGEKNLSVGAIQAKLFWDELLLGAGILNERIDFKYDHLTPVDYLAFKAVASWFPGGFGSGWQGKLGIGLTFGFIPALDQKKVSLGIVKLFDL